MKITQAHSRYLKNNNFRYQEALRTEEYKHIKPETAQQFLECFHKFENSIEGSDTWFETSANGNFVEFADGTLSW